MRLSDTGGISAAGIVDTGATASLKPMANLPPVSFTPVANLPSVSTTLANLVEKFAAGVVDTDTWNCEISPRIFEKIRNGFNGILWGWGELIREKNQKQKIS